MPDESPHPPGDGRPITPSRVGRAGRRTLITARLATQRATRAATSRWDRWLSWFEGLGLSENATLLIFAVAVGLASAAAVIAFYRAIDLVYLAFFEWPLGALGRLPAFAYRTLVTAAALAGAAAMWRRFGKGGDGLTVPDVQVAVVRRAGRIPAPEALGRTAASAVTIGGGGSAGSEGPVAVVGAAAGSFLSKAFRFAPERTVVLVGAGAAAGIAAAFNAPLAGAFFALEEILGSFRVAAGAPITGILLVFEMTNDYAIMLPLMLAVAVGTPVARWLDRDDLYSGWLRRRGEHVEHGTDRDVLAGLRVSDAYDPDPVVVSEETPVASLLAHIGHRDQSLFPVVDDAGLYVGVLTTADLGAVARAGHALDDVLIAADVARPSATLAPTDSLLAAVRQMGVRGDASLPVVDSATGALRGVVSRSQILGLYERAVARADGQP